MFNRVGRVVVTSLVGVLLLAACSEKDGPVRDDVRKSADYVRNQFIQAETAGGAMGELMAALRVAEPELYEQAVALSAKNLAEGMDPYEAGAAAQALHRNRFQELVKTTSDAEVSDMLELSMRQAEYALTIGPRFCLDLLNNRLDVRTVQVPQEIAEREALIMARVIRIGEQNAPVATPGELTTWMEAFAASNPEAAESINLMAQPGLPDDQARQVCESQIALWKAMFHEEPAARARLFRGLMQAD